MPCACDVDNDDDDNDVDSLNFDNVTPLLQMMLDGRTNNDDIGEGDSVPFFAGVCLYVHLQCTQITLYAQRTTQTPETKRW